MCWPLAPGPAPWIAGECRTCLRQVSSCTCSLYEAISVFVLQTERVENHVCAGPWHRALLRGLQVNAELVCVRSPRALAVCMKPSLI